MKNLQSVISVPDPSSGLYYTIERRHKSFKGMVVNYTLHIPYDDERQLKGPLLFGDMRKIGEKVLGRPWGFAANGRDIYTKSPDIIAITWAEAFTRAQDSAERDVFNLERAFATTIQTLNDAINELNHGRNL